jgi:hypothetical protein
MKLEWHDYYMGSLKAPLENGGHYLINMTASGGGLQARYSDGKGWKWSENFSDDVAAKQACEDHHASQS